jgi:hypothetical protein
MGKLAHSALDNSTSERSFSGAELVARSIGPTTIQWLALPARLSTFVWEVLELTWEIIFPLNHGEETELDDLIILVWGIIPEVPDDVSIVQ